MSKVQYLTAPADTYKLARFVSTRLRELDDWSFIHVDLISDDGNCSIDEALQFIGYHFQDRSCLVLSSKDKQDVIIVTKNKNNTQLITFDGKLYESFPPSSVQTNTFSMNFNTLEKLGEILAEMAPSNDVTFDINLKRMKRSSNTMMVVDDDLMVCKQFEQILSGIGTCIIRNNGSDFIETYKQNAPDILFLDIHLQTDHGPDLMKKLYDDLDSHAHVIMISSDTYESTIKEVKSKGAKGFIVKPLNRQQLFAHVMKMPTFLPRRA